MALAAGAYVTTIPFGHRVRRYALGGLATALLSGFIRWDGAITRPEGAVLVAAYVAFVASIWILERQPPALGETAELNEVRSDTSPIGRDLILVIVGLAALTGGSIALVESVRRISGIEETQTRLGLTVVGFATAFVLAWSASRRGITDAVVAGVVGSYAYNLTMSLGAGALIAPLAIDDAASIRAPFVAMVVLLLVVLALASRHQSLSRAHVPILLAGYAAFIAGALLY
jgi:cation:H+ antiporter